jgi:hypothetical protein
MEAYSIVYSNFDHMIYAVICHITLCAHHIVDHFDLAWSRMHKTCLARVQHLKLGTYLFDMSEIVNKDFKLINGMSMNICCWIYMRIL